MTHDERRELARALAALDVPHPLLDPRLRRRRRIALLVLTVCCVALAGWIAILLQTLPEHYTSSDWRAVWVGLDIAELLGFAATAWAAWHERQILIFFMIITGTLLLCDAWFDLTLSYGSSGFTDSILSALLAEFPLAFLMFAGARRLVRVAVRDAHGAAREQRAGAAAVADPAVRRRPGRVPTGPAQDASQPVTAGNRPSS